MDRVVIQPRERPLSSDVLNGDAILGRLSAQMLRFLGRSFISQTGGLDDVSPTSVTEGLSCRPSGTTVTVKPGILAQLSPGYPGAPGQFESPMRVGQLHSDKAFGFAPTPNSTCLMEIRVVDVVTQVANRDVLDAGSGQFVPTNVDKVISREIEAQFTFGTLVSYPAFNGGTWVPYGLFTTDANGLFSGAWVDLRIDIADLLSPLPDMAIPPPADEVIYPRAEVLKAEMRTSPPNVPPNLFVGLDFVGTCAGRRMFAKTPTFPIPADGTLSGSTILERIYCCPLIKGSIWAVPKVAAFGNIGIGGILVRSQVLESRYGRTNDDPIQMPTIYGNYDNVPRGEAIHIGTLFRGGGGTGYVGGQHQSCQGDFAGGSYNTNITADARRVTTTLGVVAALNRTVTTFDLDAVLPRNARIAKVLISIQANTSAASGLFIHVYPAGVADPPANSIVAQPDDFVYAPMSTPVAPATASDQWVLDLPVNYDNAFGGDIGRQWKVAISTQGGITANFLLVVTILGWKL